MTSQEKALRRNDFWACALLLVAGIAAQLAMWQASQRDAYLVATPLLALVTAAGAWQRTARPMGPVRVALQGAKLLACMGLLAYFFTSGLIMLPEQHAIGQSPARPSMTATVGAILLVGQLVQSATATTRRDLSLAAPAICAMLAQAGVAAHDAAPAPAFVVALVTMIAGVALVFRGELLDESVEVVATRRWFVVPSVVLQVVALAAVVFVLAPDSFALHARSVSHAKPPKPTSPSVQGGASALDPHSQAIADPGTGRLDLHVRGALSNAPVFVVPAAAPPYWQGAVYDHYDGAGWTITGESTRRPWSVDATTTPPTQRAPADRDATAGQAQSRTDMVQIVTPQVQHVVFAPGRVTAYAGPGTVSSDGVGNARLTVSATGPPSSRDYNVVSTRPNPPTSEPPASAAADIRDPRWLQLPANLPQRVTSLSHRLIDDAPSRAAAVDTVDKYLRGVATYNLDAPVAAPGEDSVDSFLFVTREGFCEQFASAAVVLLRAAGIPARLVTGYSQGDLTSDPGRRVMRAADAHAWVQVWYPGVGWVDSDPTASAVLGATPDQAADASPAAEASVGASPSAGSSGAGPSSASPSAAPESNASPNAEPSARAATDHVGLRDVVGTVPGGRFGLAAFVVGLVLAGRGFAVIGRRRGRRRATARGALTPGGGPVLQAYLRLDDELSRHGHARATGETAGELRSRLGGLPGSPVPARTVGLAIDLLERECYGIEPLTESETSFAVDVFGQLLVSVSLLESFGAPVAAK
ncbi:MAG TPA: transglutaminaseTgpA domain-containing protein [Acidothermaceae bacterium]